MLHLLLAELIVVFIISYIVNRRDITSPAVVFSGAFTIAIALASFFMDYLSLDLHSNTFNVISVGVITFSITCFLSHYVFKGYKKKHKRKSEVSYIKIDKLKEVIFIMIEVGTILLSCYSLLRIMNSGWSGLLSAIHVYRENTMHKGIEMDSFPAYVKALRVIVSAAGYWFTYVLMQNYSISKRIEIRKVLIIALSMISSIITGGRGVAIYYIFSGAIIYFFVYKNFSTSRKARVKIWKLFVYGGIFFALFIISGNLIGRNISGSYARYLVLYCGAEIKNLDTFLQGDFPTSKHFAQETFITFFRSYGGLFGLPLEEYTLYHPFRYAGTVYLGNVCTIFQAFLSDFGYAGIIPLTSFMAIISQLFYEIAKREKPGKDPNIPIIIYAFMAGMLFFSFFSNKFFEELLSKGFIQNVICWVLFYYVFVRLRIRKGGYAHEQCSKV